MIDICKMRKCTLHIDIILWTYDINDFHIIWTKFLWTLWFIKGVQEYRQSNWSNDTMWWYIFLSYHTYHATKFPSKSDNPQIKIKMLWNARFKMARTLMHRLKCVLPCLAALMYCDFIQSKCQLPWLRFLAFLSFYSI